MPDHPDPKVCCFRPDNERGARRGDGLEKEPSSVSSIFRLVGLQVLRLMISRADCSQAANLTLGATPPQRLLPTGGTGTNNPPRSTREIIIRHRGGKIVAHGLTEGEKLVRHHGANCVTPTVSRCRLAGAVAKPSRVQPRAAWLQGFTKAFSGHRFLSERSCLQFKCPPTSTSKKNDFLRDLILKAQGCGIDGRISLRIFRLALGQLALPLLGAGPCSPSFPSSRPSTSGMACVFFWEGKRKTLPGRSVISTLFAALCREPSGWATWRGLPWPLRRRARRLVLDVGLRLARDGDQVLHLFARRDVPWQGCGRGGAGRPHVFHPRRTGRKMETLGYLLCRLRTIQLSSAPQSNQLTQIVRSMFSSPKVGLSVMRRTPAMDSSAFCSPSWSVWWWWGSKESDGPSRLVPGMVLLYGGTALVILLLHAGAVGAFPLSFRCLHRRSGCRWSPRYRHRDRGAPGRLFQRGGHGDRSHGSRGGQDKEPIREGLVAMWGPVIDTLFMCTLTGLVLLVTGVWNSGEGDGVLLTTQAFERALPGVGPYLLLAGVLCLSFSSMLGFPITS